jgi:hypothetical protein
MIIRYCPEGVRGGKLRRPGGPTTFAPVWLSTPVLKDSPTQFEQRSILVLCGDRGGAGSSIEWLLEVKTVPGRLGATLLFRGRLRDLARRSPGWRVDAQSELNGRVKLFVAPGGYKPDGRNAAFGARSANAFEGSGFGSALHPRNTFKIDETALQVDPKPNRRARRPSLSEKVGPQSRPASVSEYTKAAPVASTS